MYQGDGEAFVSLYFLCHTHVYNVMYNFTHLYIHMLHYIMYKTETTHKQNTRITHTLQRKCSYSSVRPSADAREKRNVSVAGFIFRSCKSSRVILPPSGARPFTLLIKSLVFFDTSWQCNTEYSDGKLRTQDHVPLHACLDNQLPQIIWICMTCYCVWL